MKEFKDYYNGELHEFRVINKAQRRKMALRLKKLTKSAAFKKKVEKSKLRVANPAKQRVKTDQLIQHKYGGMIAKLSMKLGKVVKAKEIEKVKKAREAMKQDA